MFQSLSYYSNTHCTCYPCSYKGSHWTPVYTGSFNSFRLKSVDFLDLSVELLWFFYMLGIQRRRSLLHLGMFGGQLYQQHFRFATLPNIAKHTSFRKYHKIIQMHPCTTVLCLLLGRLWRTWVSLCGTGSARSWSTSLVARQPSLSRNGML